MVDVQAQQPIDDTTPIGYEDGKSRSKDQPYDLGEAADAVFEALSNALRQIVIERGRQMAELTIPSIAPPLAYRTGDYLPGTNQSVSAAAINNLASLIMFMAFPPGQPMLRLTPNEQKLQKQIDADPQLYSMMQLALSRVELAHREEAANIGLATAWVGFIKHLLVTGNCLWKHIKLGNPTFHSLDYYACQRDVGGHPVLTIHRQPVLLVTLPDDVQEIVLHEKPELSKQLEWTRETFIYSICRLMRDTDDDDSEGWSWEYWEETEKGTLIPGTSMTTDYDDCPMWPGWMIPVYGQSYGRSYCEEYQGDLYIVESSASALNDGAAQASLALTFVKPGSRTSLKQVQKAPNLSFLSGSAEDMSVFRADKQADFQFVNTHFESASQRVNKAFCVKAASIRNAERVTAEEVERTGADLDQGMGGLFTQIAQSHQRQMVKRFVHLHNESNDAMPDLPKGLIKIQVITGTDAMGRSAETQNLTEFAEDLVKAFPPNYQSPLDPLDYARRQASSRGIKPDGLVKTQQDIDAKEQAQQQAATASQATVAAAGPAAGAAAGAIAQRMPPLANNPQGATPPNGR